MAWSRGGNIKGPPGDDAYTVAVKAGFQGTKAQWLASLTGPPGPRGATWTIGSGAPTATAGVNAGDLYLDKDTGDVYQAG